MRRGISRGVRPWPVMALLLVSAACAPLRQGGGDTLRDAFAQADSVAVRTIAPGVRHAYAWEAEGPWAIHVAEVEPRACVALEARHAGPPLARAAPVSAIAPDALVAVNADFFALPKGTPVGAQVRAGEVLVAPGRWQAAALEPRPGTLGTAELRGDVRGRSAAGPLTAVNRPAPDSVRPPGDLRLFTRWFGAASPPDSGRVAVRVRRGGQEEDGGAWGIVVRVDTIAGVLPLDSVHVVVSAVRGAPGALAGASVGDTLRWRSEVRVAGDVAREVVGGFPVLLRAGAVPAELATEPRPAFGERRHPRTAVGWTADGALLLVTVDGRQAPYSDGMTLHELAELMRRLGATDALNLDGGGSTAMVVRGAVVNRPSDESGERPVGNAVAVVARDCG